MPFPFVYVCDLLQELERLFTRDVPLLSGRHQEELREKTSRWFKRHYRRLDEQGTDSGAVLSMLRPQKVTDRVYGMDCTRLELVIARALNLTRAQYASLQKWKTEPINGDLAVCVCKVMENMEGLRPRARSNEVMVEDIDQALLQIAAFNKDSSLEVRSLAQTWDDADYVTLLGDLYQNLQGREAKWLTRIVLKNLSPLQFPETLELSASPGHSHLPKCLNVSITLQDISASAIRREGHGLIQGSSSSSAPAKPSAHANNPAFLPTLSTSSPSIPISVTPSSIRRSSKIAATKSTHALSTLKLSGAISPSFRPVLGEVSANSSHSAQRSSPSFNTDARPELYIVTGSGTCQLTSKKCPLTTCIFILAPCISNLPWLTENLLRWHGSHFATSVSAVGHPSLPRRCPKSGKPYRKIVLVESNRTEPTVKFLKQISKLIQRKNDKQDWVGVYDWRLLECLAKVDQGKELSFNPWKRCWIMTV